MMRKRETSKCWYAGCGVCGVVLHFMNSSGRVEVIMSSRPHFACFFERFPSFTQTFVAREVMEMERQGRRVELYSARGVSDEAVRHFPAELVGRTTVLPGGEVLRREVEALKVAGALPPAAVMTLREWGTRPDKGRLYEALWTGHRLREAGVGHVHTHFAGLGARTCWWMRQFFGLSYSITGHANDLFCPEGETLVTLEHLVEDAAAVVAVSDFTQEWLRGKFPASARRIYRVYNGLDLGPLEEVAGRTEKDAVPLVVSVGRLIEKKGYADLIRACGVLMREGVEFRCVIAGEGPLAGELAARIAEEGLGAVVALAGPLAQEAVGALLARARVFALPCVVEADGGMDVLPTVLMEAMAAGVPCVSTRLAGVPEMVVDGETGRLTAPGDVTALAAALREFLSNEAVAKRMGVAGQVLARGRFSLDVTGGQLWRVLARAGRVRMGWAEMVRTPQLAWHKLCNLGAATVRAPRLRRTEPVFPSPKRPRG